MALFKAGDVNDDGDLSFDKFRAIVETVDASLSAVVVSRMFWEALEASAPSTSSTSSGGASAQSVSKSIVYAVA